MSAEATSTDTPGLWLGFLGWLFLIAGIAAMIIGATMDISLDGYGVREKVVNLHKMHKANATMIIGGFAFLGGIFQIGCAAVIRAGAPANLLIAKALAPDTSEQKATDT